MEIREEYLYQAANDPVAILDGEHEEVERLFERFETALEHESGEARAIADEICRLLELHHAVEEEVVYGCLAKSPEMRGIADIALAQHLHLREAIAAIRDVPADDPSFAPLVLELMDEVERHMDSEEHVMFAHLEGLREQHPELAARLRSMRRRLS